MDKATLKVISLMVMNFFKRHKMLLDAFKDIDQETELARMYVHHHLIDFNLLTALELEGEINELLNIREELRQCMDDEESENLRQNIIFTMTALTINYKIICDMAPAQLKEWINQHESALKS